jgi:hypothetical protein
VKSTIRPAGANALYSFSPVLIIFLKTSEIGETLLITGRLSHTLFGVWLYILFYHSINDLMNLDPSELKLVQKVLWPDENVIGTINQRRVGPGGSVITPTTVVVTDKRLIIVNRASMGLRQDYEVIPYNAIVSVRLEHGLISSTVFIRVLGYETDKGLLSGGKQEGEIDGLRNNDAVELSDFINKKLEERLDAADRVDDQIAGNAGSSATTNIPGAYIYCNKCGTKNSASAKFCSSCGAPLTK